jgi:phage tail-like protein
MLGLLPAVFAQNDEGALSKLLDVLGDLFFDGSGSSEEIDSGESFPGLERQMRAIPGLFLPLQDDGSDATVTPDRFLPWLAAWLSFSPHEHLDRKALRRVLANIVPLNGRRGTRYYLERLLDLAFGDLLATVAIDDTPQRGFTIGTSVLGRDTRLARGLSFFFQVTVQVREGVAASSELERRLRAVIDYAKPAHTRYELNINEYEAAGAWKRSS